MPDAPTIDLQAIENLKALSPDDGAAFLRELIEIYLSDTPQRLAELEQALSQQNATALARAAHTIKGSSSNFGAARLAQLGQEIEIMGKTSNLGGAGPACLQLKEEFTRVAAALAKVALA